MVFIIFRVIMDFRACLIQVEKQHRQDILTIFSASPCDIHMCSKSDLRELSLRDAFTYRVAHSGSKWLKPAKNNLTWCYIRYYVTNFHHSAFIRFTAFPFRLSCIFIFKICCNYKYDWSISRIFKSNFWRVFAIWANYVARYTVSGCALRSWS